MRTKSDGGSAAFGDASASALASPHHHLSIFASDTMVATPAQARALLNGASDIPDVNIARFERTLLKSMPGHLRGHGVWAAPSQARRRGIRLALMKDASVDLIVEVEAIARSLGLGVLDEELEEISFPTRLARLDDVRIAARSLQEAGDGYLLVESGVDDACFIHAIASRQDGSILLEAVANCLLPESARLSRAQIKMLLSSGWKAPGGEQVNHWRTVRGDLAASGDQIAALVCDTLGDVYGVGREERITICLSLG